MDPFSPLNFVLSLFGCNFFRKSYWIQVLCWILFTLHASKAYFVLADYITIGRHLTKDVVTFIIWYMDIVFDVMFLLIMAWNRRHFEKILRKLSAKLNLSDMKSLWKLSIFGLVFSMLVENLAKYGRHTLQGINHQSLLAVITKFFWIWTFKDSFLICGRIVFCYFIRLVTLEEKRFLRSIVDQSLTPSSVSVNRRNLQSYRQFVVDKFSIIPVIWFLRELVVLVAFTVRRNEVWTNFNSTNYFLVCLLVSVNSMAAHIFMICYVDHCVMDVKEETARMTRILVQKDYRKWRSIIIEFDIERDKQDITTCSMIEINKKTGLCFITNLITLTVLFEQLVSSLN